LQFEAMLSEQAPTLARIQIQADDGAHGFLVHRDLLEKIAKICLEIAPQMSKAADLS
jgi:hypothetical protein